MKNISSCHVMQNLLFLGNENEVDKSRINEILRLLVRRNKSVLSQGNCVKIQPTVKIS